MSIGAILIGLALVIITIPIVASPVMNKQRERFFLEGKPEKMTASQAYQAALTALRDLDFDHDLGVVSDEDYPVLRTQLLAEAVSAREATGFSKKDDIEARIEAAIRARRKKRPLPNPSPAQPAAAVTCYQCGAEMEPADRFCTACGSAAAPVCAHCGQQAEPGDKFCAGCGKHLPVWVAA
ncbi:MAG: hypothetical protein Kow0080_00190 [Candidatus Promineifilaceae bacterium]